MQGLRDSNETPFFRAHLQNFRVCQHQRGQSTELLCNAFQRRQGALMQKNQLGTVAHCLERRKLIARTIRHDRRAFWINAMRQNGQDGIFVVALGRSQPPPWRILKGAEIITGETMGWGLRML